MKINPVEEDNSRRIESCSYIRNNTASDLLIWIMLLDLHEISENVTKVGALTRQAMGKENNISTAPPNK